MGQLRFDVWSDRWVLMATDRPRRRSDFVTRRPPMVPPTMPCPLCPSAADDARAVAWIPGADGTWSSRSSVHRFPLLRLESSSPGGMEHDPPYCAGPGAHEVLSASPLHGQSLVSLGTAGLLPMLELWHQRVVDLAGDHRLGHASILHREGAEAGQQLDHPHAQLLAFPTLAIPEAARHDRASLLSERRGRCAFCQWIESELAAGTRVVAASGRWVALCPWASAHPFEVWIVAREHQPRFAHTLHADRVALAAMLFRVVSRVDHVLERAPWTLTLHDGLWRRDQQPWHAYFALRPIPAPQLWASADGVIVNPVPPEEACAWIKAGWDAALELDPITTGG